MGVHACPCVNHPMCMSDALVRVYEYVCCFSNCAAATVLLVLHSALRCAGPFRIANITDDFIFAIMHVSVIVWGAV